MENDKKNIMILIRTANDLNRLELYLNKGLEIKTMGRHGKQDYYVLGKPEIRPVFERPEIESFRVLNPKSEDCQKETGSLQRKGFKIDSVTPSSAILIKYSNKVSKEMQSRIPEGNKEVKEQ